MAQARLPACRPARALSQPGRIITLGPDFLMPETTPGIWFSWLGKPMSCNTSKLPLTARPEREDNTAMVSQRASSKAAAIVAASLLVLGGCEDRQKQTTISAIESLPEDKKPRAKEGEACQTNQECDDRLGCAPDKTCQTYKTIECSGREQTCKKEGRCRGSDVGCIAGSDEDCKQSEACRESGYCTAKAGKCIAAKETDCKEVCAKQGRCSIEEGECVPGSDADCKQSELCKAQAKCVVRRGLCAKAPPPED